MTALTLALLAGMAVGSGPERIPEETRQHFLGNGYWEGTWKGSELCGLLHMDERAFMVTLEPGLLRLRGEGHLLGITLATWIDEGKGRFRIAEKDRRCWWGIYKRGEGCLVICLKKGDKERPTLFCPGDDQALLILKPAKPPKK